MPRQTLLMLALWVCLPTAVQATITINAGDHFLLPDTPGQIIDVLISSTSEELNAMDLYMDINGGVGPAPAITGYNLQFTPTIWAAEPTVPANYGPPYEPPPPTLIFASGVFIPSVNTTISANGILAQLTFDTTGFFASDGPWVLRLSNDDWGQTLLADSFNMLSFVRNDGSLAIVPEPSTASLCVFAVAAIAAIATRNGRPVRGLEKRHV